MISLERKVLKKTLWCSVMKEFVMKYNLERNYSYSFDILAYKLYHGNRICVTYLCVVCDFRAAEELQEPQVHQELRARE